MRPAPECAPARRQRGFTLLEVLVALLLLSLALVGLVRITALEARALAQVNESTMAQWVAANAIAEVRLREANARPGRRDGRAEMGGRRWQWRMQIVPTEEARILRLDVQVFIDHGLRPLQDPEPIGKLSGFLRR